MEDKMSDIAKKAQEAFWAVIAERFPGVPGDTAPQDAVRFDQACADAASRWIANNVYKEGQRIRLVRDVDRYPHFIAEKGMTGTVVESSPVSGICVRMDGTLPNCEEWDNCVVWYEDDILFAADDIEVMGGK